MAHTTPAFSVRMLVRLRHEPGTLGRFATAVGELGGNITKLSGFEVKGDAITREIVVDAASEEHAARLVDGLGDLTGVEILEADDIVFHLHRGGKLEVVSRFPLRDRDDLSIAYTPGVARVCRAIADDPAAAWEFTGRGTTIAVVSDGTAVLGLGDIGPLAAMPVMEGKAMLFKEFGGVDAVPIVLDTTDPDEIVETVIRLAPSFGGVNLEDIAAPACFVVEDRLRDSLDIPVFHDDQHGTAIVVLAALDNACRLTERRMRGLRVVIAGAGAAGVAIAKILTNAGVGDIVVTDSRGAIWDGREDFEHGKAWLAAHTNPRAVAGTLADALVGADCFIGVSRPDIVERSDVAAMAKEPIVFALSNPDPEVDPDSIGDLAGVLATGRSDYPNQINNVLAFPGVFAGALRAGATAVTESMKLAAADAIAAVVRDDLAPDRIVPEAMDRSVGPAVAEAVARAAVRDGVCR
ncbi:MAG: NAD-dependent malic enzyme [Acidimicrobiia bacterium]